LAIIRSRSAVRLLTGGRPRALNLGLDRGGIHQPLQHGQAACGSITR
jgi:hypothetical protein